MVSEEPITFYYIYIYIYICFDFYNVNCFVLFFVLKSVFALVLLNNLVIPLASLSVKMHISHLPFSVMLSSYSTERTSVIIRTRILYNFVFYIVIYVVCIYMRNYCDGEKTGLQILMDLHILSPPEYKKWFLICHISINMWMEFIQYSGVSVIG
jgi:hypothetical protein